MISSISCIDLVYANILEIFLKIVAVFGNCTSHYPISGNGMTLFFLMAKNLVGKRLIILQLSLSKFTASNNYRT